MNVKGNRIKFISKANEKYTGNFSYVKCGLNLLPVDFTHIGVLK